MHKNGGYCIYYLITLVVSQTLLRWQVCLSSRDGVKGVTKGELNLMQYVQGKLS